MNMDHAHVLDHFYVELSDQRLAVVVGNWHSQCCIVGYVKYAPTRTPSIWSKRFTNYERLVKVYTPEEVYSHTSWTMYIPFFDSSVPYIPVSCIRKIYNPIQRATELHYRVNDQLEKQALELISLIEHNTNVLPGVTGSLLPGIHNVQLSDIDLVVYGFENSRNIVEFIEYNKDTFKPLSGERLKTWLKNTASLTGLAEHEVLKYYRSWRRGLFAGREYSLIYNDGIYREVYTMPSYKTRGILKAVIEVQGGLQALNYPSIGLVDDCRIIEVQGKVDYDVNYVMSYEALYIPGLYEGGLFEVSGLLQCSTLEETCRVVIGSREYKGTMKWLYGFNQ